MRLFPEKSTVALYLSMRERGGVGERDRGKGQGTGDGGRGEREGRERGGEDEEKERKRREKKKKRTLFRQDQRPGQWRRRTSFDTLPSSTSGDVRREKECVIERGREGEKGQYQEKKKKQKRREKPD